jgi:hypothetical protein
MKYSLLAALLLNSGLAYSATEQLPTCASLHQKTLYAVHDRDGNWGQANCWGGDEVEQSYVVENVVLEIRWEDSSRRCVVLKGEYLWSCKEEGNE